MPGEMNFPDLSTTGRDSLTPPAIFADWSTSGWIPAHPDHWAIEPFIPTDPETMRLLLSGLNSPNPTGLADQIESSAGPSPGNDPTEYCAAVSTSGSHRDHPSIGADGLEKNWAAFDRAIQPDLDAWVGSRIRRLLAIYRCVDPDLIRPAESAEPETSAKQPKASAKQPKNENASEGASGFSPPKTGSKAEKEPHGATTESEATLEESESAATTGSGALADSRESVDSSDLDSANLDSSEPVDSAKWGDMAGSVDSAESVTLTLEALQQLALDAGYRELTREEIDSCVGVASSWGVPLKVDFDVFLNLKVYARGDVIGRRIRRHWKRLYRMQVVEVPIYQRMIVAFELERSDALGDPDRIPGDIPPSLHLRLFKNIPKQDIDMLLPGSKIKMKSIDRVKIILPSLGSFLLSLRKVAQLTLLFAALALHWSAIVVALVIGYAVKSVMSYFQTRNRYQLKFTQNLYFQKLCSGRAVISELVSQAAAQRTLESMLAYHVLTHAKEPLSTRRVKRRAERHLREVLGIEIDFRVARAMTMLAHADLANFDGLKWKPSSLCPMEDQTR